MKKIKDILGIGVFVCVVVGGIGLTMLVKYKIWRAEHPQAQTWTFFIPSKK